MGCPLISQETSASPLMRTQKEAVWPSVTIAGRGVLMNSTGGEISVKHENPLFALKFNRWRLEEA